jgi:hypothetical protein
MALSHTCSSFVIFVGRGILPSFPRASQTQHKGHASFPVNMLSSMFGSASHDPQAPTEGIVNGVKVRADLMPRGITLGKTLMMHRESHF